MAAATYYLGTLVKKTRIKDEYIPFILTAFAIILVLMGELAGTEAFGERQLVQAVRNSVLMGELAGTEAFGERQLVQAVRNSIVKGLVVAMSAVYVNQIIKKGNCFRL